jgi:predicted chitinase/GNAT superfamily N-acetyltransferase
MRSYEIMYENISGLEIVNNVEDSFRGGYQGTLIAKTPEQQVGYLNYSIYRDRPSIHMIYVAPEFRRSRIARQMLKALQELSPDEEIDWGITTPAGSKLRGSIDYIRRPNPEIIKKKQKLAGVKSKLAQMNYKLEQLQKTNPELARKYISTVSDRWNELNSLEYRLENELYLNKGEYRKIIPEDELEEGFKQQLANLGFAAAMGAGAVGGMAVKDKVSQFMNPQPTVASQTQASGTVKPITAPVAAKKKPQVAKVQPKIEPITDNPLEKKLMAFAQQAGLTGIELAQFLAQTAHETMDYARMIEYGGKKYFNRYERKYAPTTAKLLGNVKPGDGIRYRGRGYIQLTGRYNYRIAGKALGLPLEAQPDLAADPDIAAKIAVWYWNSRVKPEVNDFTNTTAVTKKINPKLFGLQDRHQNFLQYIKADPNDL